MKAGFVIRVRNDITSDKPSDENPNAQANYANPAISSHPIRIGGSIKIHADCRPIICLGLVRVLNTRFAANGIYVAVILASRLAEKPSF